MEAQQPKQVRPSTLPRAQKPRQGGSETTVARIVRYATGDADEALRNAPQQQDFPLDYATATSISATTTNTTTSNPTLIWLKCFAGTRSRVLMTDPHAALEGVREAVEEAFFGDTVRPLQRSPAVLTPRFLIDYLDEYGRRVHLDSQERWQEAVQTYLRTKRNYIYLFCDMHPTGKAAHQPRADVTAPTVASRKVTVTRGNNGPWNAALLTPNDRQLAGSSGVAISSADAKKSELPAPVDTIQILNEERSKHLVDRQSSMPRGPRYRKKNIYSWDEEKLASESPVIARYQQEVHRRAVARARSQHSQAQQQYGAGSGAADSYGSMYQQKQLRHSGGRLLPGNHVSSNDSLLSDGSVATGARPTRIVSRVDSYFPPGSPVLSHLNHPPRFYQGYVDQHLNPREAEMMHHRGYTDTEDVITALPLVVGTDLVTGQTSLIAYSAPVAYPVVYGPNGEPMAAPTPFPATPQLFQQTLPRSSSSQSSFQQQPQQQRHSAQRHYATSATSSRSSGNNQYHRGPNTFLPAIPPHQQVAILSPVSSRSSLGTMPGPAVPMQQVGQPTFLYAPQPQPQPQLQPQPLSQSQQALAAGYHPSAPNGAYGYTQYGPGNPMDFRMAESMDNDRDLHADLQLFYHDGGDDHPHDDEASVVVDSMQELKFDHGRSHAEHQRHEQQQQQQQHYEYRSGSQKQAHTLRGDAKSGWTPAMIDAYLKDIEAAKVSQQQVPKERSGAKTKQQPLTPQQQAPEPEQDFEEDEESSQIGRRQGKAYTTPRLPLQPPRAAVNKIIELNTSRRTISSIPEVEEEEAGSSSENVGTSTENVDERNEEEQRQDREVEPSPTELTTATATAAAGQETSPSLESTTKRRPFVPHPQYQTQLKQEAA